MTSRIEREKHTVSLMIRLYCRRKEGNRELCSGCRELEEYAHKRLSSCRYGEQKTSCKKCPTHCYRKDMREKIRQVMRFAGPRMILYHPIKAIENLLKYILISILALAFCDGVKDGSSSIEYDLVSELQAEHIFEQDTFVSSPRTDICPPRQVSTFSVPRVQTSSRHDSSNRHGSEFVKSCKTTLSGCNYISRNKTLIQYSPYMDPDHKLVRLRRFII